MENEEKKAETRSASSENYENSEEYRRDSEGLFHEEELSADDEGVLEGAGVV